MTNPKVSVIVLNRDRAASLAQTLMGLKQQRFRDVEIIVVSNAAAPLDLTVNWLKFDIPNVSAARNFGLRHARGEIVAFCDDDAVPEAGWIGALVEGFADSDVVAAGGPVLGPDGVKELWGLTQFDRSGADCEAGAYVKINGTNCAFRREAICAESGFDERFAYYLEETDICLRLNQAGGKTVWIEDAVVHHGLMSNAVRSGTLVPKNLVQIGRSKRLFCEKHLEKAMHEEAYTLFLSMHRRRALRLFGLGVLSGGQVRKLHDELCEGLYCDVETEKQSQLERIDVLNFKTLQSVTQLQSRIALLPRFVSRQASQIVGKELVSAGHEVSIIIARWITGSNSVQYCNGIWIHKVSIFPISRQKLTEGHWAYTVDTEMQRVDFLRNFCVRVVGSKTGRAVISKIDDECKIAPSRIKFETNPKYSVRFKNLRLRLP